MAGEERRHLPEQVLTLGSRRLALRGLEARARQAHLVELRGWSAALESGMVTFVEAACDHLVLRCVFSGCGRRLRDHSAGEITDIFSSAADQHADRCGLAADYIIAGVR